MSDTTKMPGAEGWFQELWEEAPDAMVVVNQEGKIFLLNRQTERLFGYEREELLGQAVEMLIPERYRHQHAGQSGGFFTNPKMRSTGEGSQLFAMRKDGSEFQAEICLSPIENEEGTWISGAIRDVTDRKQVERQIQDVTDISDQKREERNTQREERNTLNVNRLEGEAAVSEAANLAKSTFLSTMSHEIRTPLNAILGYSQLMLRDPSLGTDSKANLKIINRSGEHLLTLINDVLDMSKIEAGRIEISSAIFSLNAMLEDLENMFRMRAEAKGLQFDMFVDGESAPYIVSDEGKIRQALINLLGNAIKFTKRGQIKLHVSIDQRSADQLWLSARVEDTGSGISDQEQVRLFEPFCQTGHGLNTQEGTGLGLAISRKFARLMGGDVTVTSSLERGSIFRFEIPIERGDAGVAVRRITPRRVVGLRAGTDGPRILVVDDQFENRDWLIKMLTAIGFSVRGAENGLSAIKEWEDWNPKLILMDVHMPGLNGLETTRRIKADPRGKETLIVILTASAMDDDRRAAERSGADDFLSKPCREDDLLEKMRALLDITYDYDEADGVTLVVAGLKALNAARLGQLPIKLVEELRKATLRGNKNLLKKLILQVHEPDPSAAHVLQELVDKYEYDVLKRMLEEACSYQRNR